MNFHLLLNVVGICFNSIPQCTLILNLFFYLNSPSVLGYRDIYCFLNKTKITQDTMHPISGNKTTENKKKFQISSLEMKLLIVVSQKMFDADVLMWRQKEYMGDEEDCSKMVCLGHDRQLHPWTYSICVCLHKTCTKSSQETSQHGWGRFS